MPRRHPQTPKPQRRPSGPWISGPTPVIGLVGGIGAGKSAAASAFAELGAFVLDADAIGHTLLDQNPCRDIIIEVFGEGVLAPYTTEGERRPVDRKALGTIVFADPFLLGRLEDILHPLMRRTFERAIGREVRRGKHKAVILDAAILYEAEWNDLCDTVVFVDSTPENRLARLEATRGWTAETLASREKAQGPLAEKRAEANHILANNDSPEALRAAAKALWPALLKPVPKPRRLEPIEDEVEVKADLDAKLDPAPDIQPSAAADGKAGSRAKSGPRGQPSA